MRTEHKKKWTFFLGIIICELLYNIYNLKVNLEPMNVATAMFNYNNGIIPRGLVGDIYQKIATLIGVNFTTYTPLLILFLGMEIALITSIAFMRNYTLKNIKNKANIDAYKLTSLAIMLSVCASLINRKNSGRTDALLIVIVVVSTIIIAEDKGLTLIPILSGIGMCIHEGFTFMYANVALCLLAYRFFKTKDKKYLIVGLMDFIVVSILFLLFAFKLNYNPAAFNEVLGNCKEAVRWNKYLYTDYLKAEMLAVNLYMSENNTRAAVALGFLMYLAFAFEFLRTIVKNVIKNAKKSENKLASACLMVGPLTLLPDFILKTDYGRWIIAFFVYVLCITSFILIEKEDLTLDIKMLNPSTKEREKTWILLMYAITFNLYPNEICNITHNVIYSIVYVLDNYGTHIAAATANV